MVKSQPQKGQYFLKLIGITLLLPLAIMIFGLWAQANKTTQSPELQYAITEQQKIVDEISERLEKAGKPDFTIQYESGGMTYGGPMALNQAKRDLEEMQKAGKMSDIRTKAVPFIIISSGISLFISIIVLGAGLSLSAIGRQSRAALVHSFSILRMLLPLAMAVQVVATTIAGVAVIAYFVLAVFHPGSLSNSEMKLVVFGVMLIGVILWVALKTIVQLRHALAAFKPNPYPIIGRQISRTDAPGIWQFVDELAEKLNALKPDHIVAGIEQGFFVISGEKTLEPAKETLNGHTLYLPLPLMPFLKKDELGAIIGHELSHFSGGDTEYSQRFVPIYASISRSLYALDDGVNSYDRFLLKPTLYLGLFVMEQFDLAVLHWSRLREFEADKGGAKVTSNEASARALLRSVATDKPLGKIMSQVTVLSDSKYEDLVSEVLKAAIEEGMGDPSTHLEDKIPHPTDTHPPTAQRIEAMGLKADSNIIAAATKTPTHDAMQKMDDYFANFGQLSRTLTEELYKIVRANAVEYRKQLESKVAEISTEERQLVANPGFILWLIGIFAILCLAGGVALFFAFTAKADKDLFIVSCVFIGFGALLLWAASIMFVHSRYPFMILRANEIGVTGLDMPISWGHVMKYDVSLANHQLITTLHLKDDAPLPQKTKGKGRVRINKKKKIITITGMLPKGLNFKTYLELLDKYINAYDAREILNKNNIPTQV